jgi:hypothetical protein
MTHDLIPVEFTDLATRIRSEHEAVRQSARQTLHHALKAGELLLEAKKHVHHGYWSDWLHEHCDMSQRTAQNYMRLARNRIAVEEKAQATADLTIEDALDALAKPRSPDVEIPADYALISSAAALLPEPGHALVGTLECGKTLELFLLAESGEHPGYYWLLHIDELDDGDGIESWIRKPVRADFIRPCFEHLTRHPNLISNIEWEDRPEDTFWTVAPAEVRSCEKRSPS